MVKEHSNDVFVSAGSIGQLPRATKDIYPGETITKESFVFNWERFKSADDLPEAVTDPGILVELKPIKKISKGDFFLNTYFDSKELKSIEKKVFKRIRKEF